MSRTSKFVDQRHQRRDRMSLEVALQIGAAQAATVERIHRVDSAAHAAQPGLQHGRAQQTGEPGKSIAALAEISVRLRGIDFERTELGTRLDALPRGSPTCDVAAHLPFFPPQTVPARAGRHRPMVGVCPRGHSPRIVI
ncbi:hypothetical protein [Nocardia asiatica]|uniref:hypothetical protein n=1 Tax=Nocardia asiatica TaxID=209252 RepID=UPI002454EB2F|nr:hypothetical protein [Nocardia asiatica]